jgi:D-beta-D-heptose 7-phosphate kinase/D-beta-D-heptose 1-phosphate adenosyltransferase
MVASDRIRGLLNRFSGQRVLVVGDVMLDRYVAGKVSRISPEAPVPVVHVVREHTLPGGAANVALNIQALGGEAVLAGVIGKDVAGDELTAELSDAGISSDGLLARDEIQTTVKTRVLAESQQVVRVDREVPLEQVQGVASRVCERLPDLLDTVGGVIIEDYGKGVVTQEVVDAVLAEAGKRDLPVGFDPKDNHELNVRGITVATPNLREALLATHLQVSMDEAGPVAEDLARVGASLKERWGARTLIITLGEHGMYVMDEAEQPETIPSMGREVFDVSGAGDTVIGAVVLSYVAGASAGEAASLATLAAGVVVGKLGAATCTPEELLANLE